MQEFDLYCWEDMSQYTIIDKYTAIDSGENKERSLTLCQYRAFIADLIQQNLPVTMSTPNLKDWIRLGEFLQKNFTTGDGIYERAIIPYKITIQYLRYGFVPSNTMYRAVVWCMSCKPVTYTRERNKNDKVDPIPVLTCTDMAEEVKEVYENPFGDGIDNKKPTCAGVYMEMINSRNYCSVCEQPLFRVINEHYFDEL